MKWTPRRLPLGNLTPPLSEKTLSIAVTFKDRHAGQLKATSPADKADIDWAKDRMADVKAAAP